MNGPGLNGSFYSGLGVALQIAHITRYRSKGWILEGHGMQGESIAYTLPCEKDT